MSAEPNPQPLFGDAIGPWHDHFAWLPIRTYDQQLVWLRKVRRRCIHKHQYLFGGADFWWQFHNQPVRSTARSGEKSAATNPEDVA